MYFYLCNIDGKSLHLLLACLSDMKSQGGKLSLFKKNPTKGDNFPHIYSNLFVHTYQGNDVST